MTEPALEIYAGQEIVVTYTLTDIDGNPVDPTSLVVTYEDQGLQSGAAVLTLLSSNLVRVQQGVFAVTIDTTAFVADTWFIQAVATGNILAVDVLEFVVLKRPLG